MFLLSLFLLFPTFAQCSDDTPLRKAIQKNDLEEASKLIKQELNLNETPTRPILQDAAGNMDGLYIAVQLINAGAPVKNYPPEAFEPLMFTLGHPSPETAAVLLAAGADPHRCNSVGDCFAKHTKQYADALELSKKCTKPFYPAGKLLPAITAALQHTIPIKELCAIITDYADIRIVCAPPPNWNMIVYRGFVHTAQEALKEYPDSIDEALEAAQRFAAILKSAARKKIGHLINAAAAAKNKK